MRALALATMALLLAGCPYKGDPKTDPGTTIVDLDGDGFSLDADCDDSDPEVNAGADEVCDGKDNDCDLEVDEDFPVVDWYRDADGDGWGTEAEVQSGCAAPEGYVAEAGDCDDTDTRFHPTAEETDCTDPNDYNCDGSVGAVDGDGDGYFACQECDDADPAVSPGRAEICNDVDDNCDGVVDTDAVDAPTWYYDTDGDGYGDDEAGIVTCDQPEGTTSTGGDCDDSDAATHPSAEEPCDDTVDRNCDGFVGYVDDDGDGWAACEDCDDGSAAVSPSGIEVCNETDDDCDGSTDEEATDALPWYADADADGYGDAAVSTSACTAPDGYVAGADDCDDTDAAYNPGAVESCSDPADYNCDGSTGYADADADGVAACEDCDDANPAAAPGLTEVCDGADNDCDAEVDEPDASDAPTWYADSDGDGWGDDGATLVSCVEPEGFVADAGDCDDSAAAAFPGGVEVCDLLDNDCDGEADNDALDAGTWYADADADGWGDDLDAGVAACLPPSGAVDRAGDCDDGADDVYPGATEVCDGRDEDCDGVVDDDALDPSDWYADADEDGYGDASDWVEACAAPVGYVDDDTDCDDLDGDVYPSALEWCNDVDDDCNGTVDDPDTTVDASTWYADADGDGYGDGSYFVTACDAPAGTTDDYTDCDDGRASVNPGGTEVCNGLDDDCSGTNDEDAADASDWYADVDEDGYGDPASTVSSCDAPDGYVSGGEDCDDTSDAVRPGATETCNSVDDDCDGSTDESASDATRWYTDADADGYGTGSGTLACTAPSGTAAVAGDCDDSEDAANPGEVEVCNDWLDNDCDGDDNGCEIAGSTTLAAGADWILDGSGANDYLGSAVALGDVSGDGAADSIVGAYGWDSTSSGSRVDGRVYVHQGAISSGDTLATADTVLSSTQSSSAFGWSVAALGDTDGDGLGDFVVGAYRYDVTGGSTVTDAGAAFLYTSQPTGSVSDTAADSVIRGVNASDQAGWVVAAAGDVDGDSLADVLVSANLSDAGYTDGGGVGLFLGPVSAGNVDITAADTWFVGAAAGEQLGAALANGEDLDADGVADVALGAYLSDSGGADAGTVYVFYGPVASGTVSAAAADVILTGATAGDQFGRSLAMADTDDDGSSDLVVGADYVTTGAATRGGAAYVFDGVLASGTSASAGASFTGVTSQDYVGRALASAGDVNGDGSGDILVSATGYDNGATSGVGAAYLLYGPFSGAQVLSSYDARLRGSGSSDAAGYALAGGGDVDEDGFADFAITSIGVDSSVSNVGASWLFYGGGY